jgi:PTH1 family peptidyl-tRNA hydrolase
VILVAGLGNPGPRYAATRHNVGFMVVERLVDQQRGGPWREKFSGRLAAFRLPSGDALALLPWTFMNESGRSVRACAEFHGLGPADIVVVHDELDLAFGDIRLKQGGGDAGHRGLKSVSLELGSAEYARLRVGIGRPPADFVGDVADYVLDGFPLAERSNLDSTLDRAVEAILLLADRGISLAMNLVNQRKT